MSWQYRVVREAGLLSIREVHSDGMFSGDPCYPSGETDAELSDNIALMLQAFSRPQLEVRGDRLVQVSE